MVIAESARRNLEAISFLEVFETTLENAELRCSMLSKQI